MSRYSSLESWQRQDIIGLYRKGRGIEAVARRLSLPIARVTAEVRAVPGLMRRYGRPAIRRRVS